MAGVSEGRGSVSPEDFSSRIEQAKQTLINASEGKPLSKAQLDGVLETLINIQTEVSGGRGFLSPERAGVVGIINQTIAATKNLLSQVSSLPLSDADIDPSRVQEGAASSLPSYIRPAAGEAKRNMAELLKNRKFKDMRNTGFSQLSSDEESAVSAVRDRALGLAPSLTSPAAEPSAHLEPPPLLVPPPHLAGPGEVPAPAASAPAESAAELEPAPAPEPAPAAGTVAPAAAEEAEEAEESAPAPETATLADDASVLPRFSRDFPEAVQRSAVDKKEMIATLRRIQKGKESRKSKLEKQIENLENKTFVFRKGSKLRKLKRALDYLIHDIKEGEKEINRQIDSYSLLEFKFLAKQKLEARVVEILGEIEENDAQVRVLDQGIALCENYLSEGGNRKSFQLYAERDKENYKKQRDELMQQQDKQLFIAVFHMDPKEKDYLIHLLTERKVAKEEGVNSLEAEVSNIENEIENISTQLKDFKRLSWSDKNKARAVKGNLTRDLNEKKKELAKKKAELQIKRSEFKQAGKYLESINSAISFVSGKRVVEESLVDTPAIDETALSEVEQRELDHGIGTIGEMAATEVTYLRDMKILCEHLKSKKSPDRMVRNYIKSLEQMIEKSESVLEGLIEGLDLSASSLTAKMTEFWKVHDEQATAGVRSQKRIDPFNEMSSYIKEALKEKNKNPQEFDDLVRNCLAVLSNNQEEYYDPATDLILQQMDMFEKFGQDDMPRNLKGNDFITAPFQRALRWPILLETLSDVGKKGGVFSGVHDMVQSQIGYIKMSTRRLNEIMRR